MVLNLWIAGGVVAMAAGVLLILAGVRGGEPVAHGRPRMDLPKLALGLFVDMLGALLVVYGVYRLS